MKPGDAVFFEALGEVAGHIGTADFHPSLLRLLAGLVPCDAQSLMLYSRYASPEYLINIGLPNHVVEFYLSGYYRFDPFHRHWRSRGRAGVVSLKEAASREPANSEYFTVFLPKSKITDDVGLFLSVAGGGALTPTLERSRGTFSRAELDRLRRVFPAIDGLHRAHVSRLFLSLAGSAGKPSSPETPRAVVVVDKDNRRVFASRAWREAEATWRRRWPRSKRAPGSSSNWRRAARSTSRRSMRISRSHPGAGCTSSKPARRGRGDSISSRRWRVSCPTS